MKTRKAKSFAELAGSKVDNNISYQTLRPFPGTTAAPPSMISNIPAVTDDDGDGFPVKRDFVVYRLKRRVAELRADEKCHLAKLSRALAALQDMQRFLELGMQFDQWETYDELMRRRAYLQGTIDMIRDPVAQVTMEEKKKVIL